MPQASDSHRARWGGGHGGDEGDESDGVGPEKAVAYLKSRGFVLTKDFRWKSGPKRVNVVPSVTEMDAANFLIDEWDFGGFS